MAAAKRCFENTYPNVLSGFSRDSNELTPQMKDMIEVIFHRLFGVLEKNVNGNIFEGDVSIYTGKAGIAYLYLLLGEKEDNSDFFKKGLALIEGDIESLRGRDVTFLCGDIGPLGVAGVLYHRLGDSVKAQQCVDRILALLPKVLDVNSKLPNELLYGRVGYLYGLLFIGKHIPGSVPSIHLHQIAAAVITAGLTNGSNASPLMWEWHGSQYLGAAHGVAGIIYLLLQVKEEISMDHLALVRSTLDHLLAIRFPSGNLPSSIGSSEDRLVHWCHGAPGFVQALLLANEIWSAPEYMQAAEQCGEVVWQFGLLKKGYGICHGVAGNAYTFLALYQATGKQLHLHRAISFGRWCGTYDQKQVRTPDRPYSLFEGLAGTVYFLKDVQDPLCALFPGYSLIPFRNTQHLFHFI